MRLAVAPPVYYLLMARELPIFPLPLVLFPGVPQPLHIFEPRYRQLLADCLAGDRRFGIAYAAPPEQEGADTTPRLGEVGCIALIRSAHELPDGPVVPRGGGARARARRQASAADGAEHDAAPATAGGAPQAARRRRRAARRGARAGQAERPWGRPSRDRARLVIERALVDALTRLVGAPHVRIAAAERVTYAKDGLTVHRRVPDVVVLPGTRDEVVALVRLLAAHDVPFVPRGAGTGLSGGALADAGAVLLVLTRLNRILKLDPHNRVAVVEPGVVNARLSAAAAPYGLLYAPDPSSQTACTIGGNVAENAGGPHCLKYGVTRSEEHTSE